MARERFIETGKGTFYGAYVYDQVVPKDHFFRKLNELLYGVNFKNPSPVMTQGEVCLMVEIVLKRTRTKDLINEITITNELN